VHRSWITRDFASNKINEMIFLTNGCYIYLPLPVLICEPVQGILGVVCSCLYFVQSILCSMVKSSELLSHLVWFFQIV
jgi:hypothetical protein